MPVMSSLGGTLLPCRGAAATAGVRAARSEPWDSTGDADFGVVINVAPFPSQMREQALVPEPRAGGNKQRSTELTCQEPPPRSQPAASPGCGAGSEHGPPPRAGELRSRICSHWRFSPSPSPQGQTRGSAAARALCARPGVTQPDPRATFCEECFINRKAERHKPPQAGKSPHVATTARAGVPWHWHRGDQLSSRVGECCLSPRHLPTRRSLNSKGSNCELLG